MLEHYRRMHASPNDLEEQAVGDSARAVNGEGASAHGAPRLQEAPNPPSLTGALQDPIGRSATTVEEQAQQHNSTDALQLVQIDARTPSVSAQAHHEARRSDTACKALKTEIDALRKRKEDVVRKLDIDIAGLQGALKVLMER